ncbi:MAG: hypothetical protein KBC69_04375 [Candidatus Magasanikbacteria bacterium]|nr:hypothetical protein [Candidatus Magasanikbacteria bacterium]
MQSPASDASLHISSGTNMPPTIAPNTETGQSLPDAPTVLFGDTPNTQIGDSDQVTPGDGTKAELNGGAADPDKTLTGDELIRAGGDFVPWRRGGI